jgi:hypothetical protein
MLSRRQQLLLRWGLPSVLVSLAIGAWALLHDRTSNPFASDTEGRTEGLTNVLERPLDPSLASFRLQDAAMSAGIAFHHFPALRSSLLPEDMGSGLAWGDYDNDGDPDLFVVNFSAPLILADGPMQPAGARCALYRNDGNGRFSDVSGAAGLDLELHGMGAAWGDYDNDGLLDLYVSAFGPNRLLRNNGDGSFSDVSAASGVDDPAFSAGVAWADFDNDGWLDLYVANYVDFEHDPEQAHAPTRQYGTEIPYTLNPSSYPAAPNRLYRNDGHGSFVDVAVAAGVDNPEGRSLQPVWFDFDQDGWLDLYVANDVSANGVFLNLGDGSFADVGARSLAADYRGAMGLAVADYDSNGTLDLFVTHWLAQENAMFENMTGPELEPDGSRRVLFMDVAESLGLGHSSLRMVGWGTGFADFDNDGRPELWVVNGHTLDDPEVPGSLQPQPLQLYRHAGERGYFDVASVAWPESAPMVGRGAAQADYDGDGRIDLAINVHGGQLRLLRNSGESGGHWLRLRLRQIGRNTHAIGTRVHLRQGERESVAQVMAGSAYLAQDETIIHLGLGVASQAEDVRIHWPDGQMQTLQALAGNVVHTIEHQPAYPVLRNPPRRMPE